MHDARPVTSVARWIALASALLAASAFSLSVWVAGWWSVSDVTVGPLGSFACFAGDCRPRGLTWLGAGERWERAAFATGAVGLFATALLVVLAAAVATRRRATTIARMTLVAVATALACGCYVVATFPGLPGMELAGGGPLYLVAIVLGAVAGVLALRAPSAGSR
jgi:hypothetical protein